MKTNPPSPTGKPWRELYLAALFETDAAELPDRIADAERALALRARQLFQTTGDHIEEEYAMDDAMYALHALRSTSQDCAATRSRFDRKGKGV